MRSPNKQGISEQIRLDLPATRLHVYSVPLERGPNVPKRNHQSHWVNRRQVKTQSDIEFRASSEMARTTIPWIPKVQQRDLRGRPHLETTPVLSPAPDNASVPRGAPAQPQVWDLACSCETSPRTRVCAIAPAARHNNRLATTFRSQTT